MSGEPVGPRWATMMTRSRKQWPEPEGPLRFLFTFSDIGVAGVRNGSGLGRHSSAVSLQF